MRPFSARAETGTRAVAERFVLSFLGQGSVEAAEAVIAPDVVAVSALSPIARSSTPPSIIAETVSLSWGTTRR
ncbi:MAG: hypothetical protein ACFBSD_15235 [Paracoccaceae bacterium]